jgi:uncharacterized protein (DUF2267 family)
MNISTSLIALSVATCVCFAAELRANPSTKAPEALLKTRPGEKVPGDYLTADYEAISARYAKAKAANDELHAKFTANKLAVGDGRQVGPLAALQAALKRDAEFLKLRGEASGWDLGVRVAEFDTRLKDVVKTILGLPTMNTKSLQLQLDKSAAAGLRRLPQIQALLAQQKFVQAEGELNEVIDEIVRTAVWFPTFDFKPFLIDIPQANELRRKHALAELQLISEQGPQFPALEQELAQAAVDLGSSGQCMWNGKPTTGPELLLALQTNWPQWQAAHKRSAMAAWTIDQIIGNATQYPTFIAAEEKFSQALPAALVKLIQSDTQRVSPTDAVALYPQYVSACAGLCAVGPRQELQAAFKPALTALATKAGLDKEVDAYRAATEPLLAWKRFLARAEAKRLAAQTPPVHDWASRVCGSPHQPNSIIPAQGSIGMAKVINSVNQVLPAVLPAGPPATITVGDVVPVSAAGQRWVARYQKRVFALVAAPPADSWKAAVAQLEQQLLVNPQLPPLTLDAATALTSARLGVFENVGGPVEQVVVEPLLTRFITLPEEAGTMLPLRAEAEDFAGQHANEQSQFLSLRCDILQPAWLQNECFVLRP